MKKRAPRVSIPEISESLANISKDSNIFIDKAMAISKRIYLYMVAKKWLQKDLAEKMGKTEAEISKLLSGTHNYTLRTLSKIEAVLDVNIITVAPFNHSKFEIQTDLKASYSVEKEVISSKGNNWSTSIPVKIIPMQTKDPLKEGTHEQEYSQLSKVA